MSAEGLDDLCFSVDKLRPKYKWFEACSIYTFTSGQPFSTCKPEVASAGAGYLALKIVCLSVLV